MSKTIYHVFEQHYDYVEEFEIYSLVPNVGKLIASYSCLYDAEREEERLENDFFMKFWGDPGFVVDNMNFPTKYFHQYLSSLEHKTIFRDPESKETVEFCERVWQKTPQKVSNLLRTCTENILCPPKDEAQFVNYKEVAKLFFDRNISQSLNIAFNQKLFNLKGYFVTKSILDDFGEDFGDGGY